MKVTTFAYIYQLVKFGDFMSYCSKDKCKNVLVSYTNTHHDVTEPVNHGMRWVKIQKLEYLENQTEFFYKIKKLLICEQGLVTVFEFIGNTSVNCNIGDLYMRNTFELVEKNSSKYFLSSNYICKINT